MDVDKILEDIGEYGFYQKKVLFLVILPCMFPCAFHAYNQLFMTDSPPNCCVKNDSVVISNTCNDGFNFNYSANSITKDYIICESNFHLTTALVLFGIAGFIGSFFFGYLQDRIGRRSPFFLYLLISCIFGIGTAYTTDYWLWLICRFGVGFIIPSILTTPHILPLEIVGPKYRTRCTIFNNMAYSFALVVLSCVVFTIRNWRYLALATSAPFLLLFVFWWYMPESPRWLLATGQLEEAIKVLKKIAKTNGTTLTDEHVLKLHENFKNNTDHHTEKMKDYGVIDLFSNRILRYKTLIVTFIWFTNTSVYVGLSYYAPVLSGDKYLNFFLAAVVELPTYLILWPSMEYFGRRAILCSSMFIGAVACFLTCIINGNTSILILFCIAKMGISSSYVVLPLFVSELYPTVVRGLGVSVGTVAGMLGPVLIPIVNHVGVGSSLPLITMGFILFVGSILSTLLPETKDLHLEEIIDAD